MSEPDDVADFSEIAAQQYDETMASSDAQLADAVWAACTLVPEYPEVAASRSRTITSKEGLRRQLPVGDTHSLFWDSTTGRIEAIFPYP